MYYNRPARYDRSRLGDDLFELRTPGYVLSEMNTVQNLVTDIDNNIKSQDFQSRQPAFVESFNRFAKEWTDFYDSNKSGFGAWWSRGTTSVYNKVSEYRNRAIEWAKQFKGLKGNLPTVLPPEKTEKGFFTRFGGWLILGGIVAGWWFTRNRE